MRDDRRGTSSDKTLSVMDLFTPERPEWTVDEACIALGQSESTVYRYFRSLVAAGLIFSIRPGRYLLGPGIVHYDRQLRTSDPLLRAGEATFLEISSEYDGPGSIFISRIYRGHVMSMHEHRLGAAPFPEGTFARGRLAPLFCGPPAFAILAFLEVRAVRPMFHKTASGDADWLEIKRRMRTIRSLGYAASVDDPDPGVLLVSAPLKHDDGGIAGSLSLSLASSADNVASIAKVGSRLVDAAADMARRVLAAVN
jgi:DNA-binding IclR family transcriptional regulator